MQQSNLSAWGEVILFLIGGLLFVLTTLTIGRLIRPHRPGDQKLSSYESGEQAIGSPWIQFNVRFYVIALMFLLFEVEIIFLFPWSTVFANKNMNAETNGQWGWLSLVEMLIFIGILVLGLAYAWVKGHLDWIKPDPRVENYKSPVPKEMYEKINKQYGKQG